MTSLEAYKNFLFKINKNDTNRNIRIGKGTFVLMYNEQADVWLSNKLNRDNDSSEKNDIEELLVHDKELEELRSFNSYTEFKLPEDHFEYEASYSLACKGKCKDRVLYNWDFKSKNKNVLFQDENNNPSFEYEQTLVNLSGGKLLVFKTDFDINKQFLTYYRRPRQIDIEGYIKVNGQPSKNVDPDISDKSVNEIVNRCAIEVIRRYENPEGFQLAKDRLTQE